MIRKKETVLEHLDGEFALCSPAVRTVVIGAWDDGDGAGYLVYPVLALRSWVRRTFSHAAEPSGMQPEVGSTIESMSANGWRYRGAETLTEPIVVHPELGIVGPISDDFEFALSDDERSVFVACSWPPEMDAERLAPFIARATAAAARIRAEEELRKTHAKENQIVSRQGDTS